jgi:thiol-disulfide isomerase/thioredoxin
VIAILAALAGAQEQPTLVVGKDAPPLTIEKWVKGEPVSFEKGKVYVVEFWATSCGHCIASMPHLSEIQDTYKDKVTIIGVTKKEDDNALEAVEAMVAAKGPGMGYTVAWDKDGATDTAWMKAAGARGIPTSFVVDAQGKIAFIGHPMTLDLPLARIVAGTWDATKGMAEMQSAFSRLNEATGMDHAMGLAALAALEKDVPELASTVASQKFRLLLLTGKSEEASALGAKLVEKAARYNGEQQMNEIAWLLVDPEMPIAKRDLDLAFRAATMAVEISKGEDGAILDTLARVHYWKGELEKAIEIQTRAVEKSAGTAEMQLQLQTVLEEYRAEAAKKGAQ